MGGGKNPAERAYGMDKAELYTRTHSDLMAQALGTRQAHADSALAGSALASIAARAVTIHLPRETLIPTPVLPFTMTYILHLRYPGRLSTGAGAR